MDSLVPRLSDRTKLTKGWAEEKAAARPETIIPNFILIMLFLDSTKRYPLFPNNLPIIPMKRQHYEEKMKKQLHIMLLSLYCSIQEHLMRSSRLAVLVPAKEALSTEKARFAAADDGCHVSKT